MTKISNNETFEDEHLPELLDFISGNGKFWFLGNGISTYPNGDENHKKIFSGCLKLEERGLVYRFIDEPNHVLFKATEIAHASSNNPTRNLS